MPFTPFHFGPGLLIKGIIPKRFSWTAFVSTQILIDCETLYNIVYHRYPLHRGLHSFLGATLAGAGTAAILSATVMVFRNAKVRKPWLKSELSTTAIWIGGIAGGASHPLLDGIMHKDVRPFMPWSELNPLLGAIDPGILHLGCVAAGLVGAGLVLMRAYRKETPV